MFEFQEPVNTGENGFELYLAANKTEKLWELLLAAGKRRRIKPCGLGSRILLDKRNYPSIWTMK